MLAIPHTSFAARLRRVSHLLFCGRGAFLNYTPPCAAGKIRFYPLENIPLPDRVTRYVNPLLRRVAGGNGIQLVSIFPAA